MILKTNEGLFLNSKKLVAAALAGMAIPFMLTLGSVVYATGSGSPAECDHPFATVSGNDNLLTYSAPAGNIVDGVCIHSGNNMFDGNQHSGILSDGTYENSCYTISGVGTQTVTVERTGTASPACQGLSHIDVLDSPSPSPTPVVTAEPSTAPSMTPSPVPTSATITTPASPTPTPVPTSTPTPTLTNTSISSTNSSDTNSGAISAASAKPDLASVQEPANLTGAVLGASATNLELPATGTALFWPVFSITSLLSGTGLIGLALRNKYTKV